MNSESRKMFAVFSIAVFCLLSPSSSAPLTCVDLLSPLAHLHPSNLTGGWALAASSTNQTGGEGRLDSMVVYFSNSTDTSVHYNQGNRALGDCFHLSYDFPIQNGVIRDKLGSGFNLIGSFLYTSCPDCLVLHWFLERDGREAHDCSLFSRRREVTQKELEEFKAQVKCLGLLPSVTMDPTKELCPEKADHDPTS